MNRLSILLPVIASFLLVGCLTVPTPPTMPEDPRIVQMTFSADLNIPEPVPPPDIRDVSIPKKSYVSFRYVPQDPSQITSGDLACSLVPLELQQPLKTTGIHGGSLTMNPVGFTVFLMVKNNSDHICNLGKSLLQFEDANGSEFAIAEGARGWIQTTSDFIDLVSGQYRERVNELLSEYKAKNTESTEGLKKQGEDVKAENNRRLQEYVSFVDAEYKPRFVLYQGEAEQYNKKNYIGTNSQGVRNYWQKPYVINIEDHMRPASYTEKKAYECSQANYAIDQKVEEYRKRLSDGLQSAASRITAHIENKRREWKAVANSAPVDASKIVRGDGLFDAIIIPPGKHRMLLIPGIRGINRWPDTIKLMLYDVPTRADAAGNVLERSNLSFQLRKQQVELFAEDQ